MTADPATPVLEVDGLYVRRSGRAVLEDISFCIERGEIVAIVGPNGAGKTTLMLAMMGLLPAAAGRILLHGRGLQRVGGRPAIARQIAYVPQQYEGFTGFTVRDMVAAGRYAHQGPFKLHTHRDREAVAEALGDCGLSVLQERIVGQLSGGERQKVFLAAALAQKSPVLFLDEPAAALDPKHQNDLVAMLRRLHGLGRTLVIICHDVNLAVTLGARVLGLRGGRLLCDEPVAEFLVPSHLRQVFDTDFARLQTAEGLPRVLPYA